MRIWLLTILAASLISGCANPVNKYTARRYYNAGLEAERTGNLAAARENYRRALINAQIGLLGPESEADAAGKLARIQGNLCEHDEAEKTFLFALEAKEKAFGKNDFRTFPTRLELAQFTFDIGKFDKAVTYYEKAFEIGGSQIEISMPQGYADVLGEYAIALAKVGRTTDSDKAMVRAKLLRSRAGEGTQGAIKTRDNYVSYPKTCK